jgi:hypothetical protein
MPLSRLENFLKNAEGNILYVSPSDFDATDSFENQGNSLARPFKTIQRALIEAARFSYQTGANNDKIDTTTILVYPGTHYIDNRPGFSIEDVNGSAVYKKRTGTSTWSVDTINPFGSSTNYDILDPANDLYKFNSVNGGVILPRGTSIIGLDLRKTKIRPLFVPDPTNDAVEPSSILNVTGTCYFTAFTIFDADVSKTVFKDYTNTKYVPSFSHHKLTAFTYADGVNKVTLGNSQTDLTDLEMYYYKISRAYGDITGRALTDYPVGLDFEPSIDEFRIVGNLQSNPLGISSIRAGNGDGTGNLTEITVTTANLQTGDIQEHGLFSDSPILISGVEVDRNSYNGSFTVSEIVGLTTFKYVANSAPSNFLPNIADINTATIEVESDTVKSASPYIFNVSLRSVYGLCGLHADGSKATGFKSMVVAQFTGVSLQKDDNAFIVYDDGVFYDDITLPSGSDQRPLHTNSSSIYKPDYENYHIRCSNDAFIQNVSVFAIGYSKHFLTESGGDMSITNSNSNFGAISLESVGFRKESFDRDDTGYITHIIPPKELDASENEATWTSLDALKIINSIDSKKLYLFGQTNEDVPPPHEVDGYRVGAKYDDKINLTITVGTSQTTYSSPVLMPSPSGVGISAEKRYTVDRSGSINNISLNTLTFTENHRLYNGEKVRIYSDTAQAPDGLEIDQIYYAITNGLGSNQIRLAISLNDAISNNPILGLNNNGGVITVVSKVSDKLPGDLGHPIQYDSSVNSWYVNSTTNAGENQIYSAIVGIGTSVIGTETGSTFFRRKLDNRSIEDKIYKIRYVIPKDYQNARPPQAGFILQESKNVGVSSISFTNDTLSSPNELRNEKVITNITSSSIVNESQTITVTTEVPHYFSVGDTVKVQKVRSTNNPLGIGLTSSYNGSHKITSVTNSKQFQYTLTGISLNPGAFTSEVNARSTRQQRESLPLVSREAFDNTFFIYRVNTIKRHIPGSDGQDGVYHLVALTSNVAPPNSLGFNLSEKEFNQDVRNLYPQTDRDNYVSDPKASISYADLNVIGKVVTDDKKHSITKESLNYLIKETKVGLAVTGVVVSGTGNTTITLYTDREHNFNSVKSFTFSSGSGYPFSTSFYSSSLVNVVSSGGTGANARVITNPSGQVISLNLVDRGTSYQVGDTLSIPGGSSVGLVTITAINNNVGDALQLSGFYQDSYNGVFEIVNIPNSKSVSVKVASGITAYTENTSGVLPLIMLSSKGVGIGSFRFVGASAGIVTVTTNEPHGLLAGNKFTIVGSGHTIYDGTFVAKDVLGITTFTFNVGVVTQTKASTTGKLLKHGISANATNLGRGEENLGSRSSYFYAGISTTISTLFNTSSSTITLTSADGFQRGDHILVNSEIIRLASTSNPFTVIRGEFGTFKTTAQSGSVVKKINVLPVEVRRPSFMRASGHTFEYLGYGPGNYSTGMPQKQSKILSEDEILVSQAREQRGGTVVYTGMNDLGEFFTGSKKLSSATGEEKVIEAPIITFTGDDAQGELSNVLNGIFDEVLVRQRITVEGGENNNQSSQFYGPVNFTQKITNVSDAGIETKNLFIKGTAAQPKLVTVGISTPTTAEIPSPRLGDISLLSSPSDYYVGNIYVDNKWKPFGLISQTENTLDISVDKFKVGVQTAGAFDFQVIGESSVEDLIITGRVVFQQPQSLGDVSFENIKIDRTARFTRIGLDPVSGATTSYTQIHDSGISQLYNLEVVGISTFSQQVDFNSNVYGIGADFGNIRIGIADDNTIDTTSGNLTINSASGTVTIIDNLALQGNSIVATAATVGIATTARILDSRILELGIGNLNNSSYIDLHNDDSIFPAYGLRIIRNTGIGSVSSQIRHRGNQPLQLIAEEAADVSIFNNNTERFRVGLSGTITSYQNNTGENLRGAHFKINQNGPGDVALSWDITHNNANRRWYAGIDTSDNYSWKLANPAVTVLYGNENFNVDTKLTVRGNGDVSIGGTFTLGGLSIHTPSVGTFNLLNHNVSTVNAFGDAVGIYLGKVANNGLVQIKATTESSDKDNGALVVDGGAGIEKNLNVGGKFNVISDTILGSHLSVVGVTTIPTAYISAGSIDNTPIGATTRSSGKFTSIDANSNSTFNSARVTDLVLQRYGEVVSNLGNVSGSAAINLSNGNVFTATLTGNTTFSFSNVLSATNSGSSFTLILTNGSGGPYTVAWPASVKFPNNVAPLRTTSAGKTDIWIFITPDQGTTWYASVALYNFS